MPYTEQIMVAEGNEESPGTDNVKLEDVSKSEGGTNLDSLPDSSNDIDDSDLIVSKEDDINWVKKTASKVWDYIKSKLDIGTTADGTYLNKAGQWSTPPDTTYNVVSKAADGLAPQLPDETTTTKYLRQDGSWNVPPNTWPDANTYKAQFLNYAYPVGSIYVSTKNVSPATFLGGTWISLSGYMLRGATSGVTANHNAKDGGADSVTVSSVASHNHTQDSHNHTQDSHNHTQNSHNHTQNAHDHPASSNSNGYVNHSVSVNRYDVRIADSTAANTYFAFTQGINKATATNIANTATNNAKTATNQAKTATNQAKGANYSVATLPQYKNVYMWERTA